MATAQRRYLVSGTDELGDVHSFESDDSERADAMFHIMSEDLNDVALQNRDG